MPFLDAKALETDPDGMAFLRAVLTPTAKKQGTAAAPDSNACAELRRAFEVAVPPASEMPITPATSERAAPAPAAV